MKHLDLFSGIGGFALAVESVWPEAEHVFCEIDPFCQQVLKKHFPNSPIHGDIKELSKKHFSTHPEDEKRVRSNESRQNSEESGHVDILTGGFPCQPFSQAGKRKAEADDRFLWPEMLRVVREARPTWILGENVAGIINLALEQVCTDLEAEGYEVQPFIIPACAVNAPHRRDRVWIVAHRKSQQCERSESKRDSLGEPQAKAGNRNSDASNTKGGGYRGKSSQECGTSERKLEPCECQGREVRGKNKRCHPSDWGRSWLEVATELCGVDDGLPVELDGFKLTKAQHRVQRLKALGNGIVPQVAIEIMKGIYLQDELL